MLHRPSRRPRVSRVLPIVTAATALLATAVPGAAQELTLEAFTASSENLELPAPVGVTAGFTTPAWGPLWFRTSVTFLRDATQGPGFVCVNYNPRMNCFEEDVRGETSATMLTAGLVPSAELGPLRLGVGGGITLSAVSYDRRNAAGSKAEYFTTGSLKHGLYAGAEATLHPLPALPVGLRASVTSHWAAYEDCAEHDYVHQPFCGTDRFTEMRIGVAYRLRR